MADKHSLPSIKDSPKGFLQTIVINGRNNLSLLDPTAPALQVECLMGDDKIHELTRSLIHLQYLTTLDLTVRTVTDLCMEHFSSYIANSVHITYLFLRFNGVSSVGAKLIGDSLTLNKSIREFGIECIQCDLLDYTIGGEGAAHIASSLAVNRIKVLSLLQCGIVYDDNFRDIVSYFSKSRHLSSVNLARNKLGVKAFTLLGHQLSNIPTLSVLILDSNVQTDQLGMSDFFESLVETNNNLEHLSLRSCQIHPTALAYLGRVLSENTKLRVLDLAGNSGLSEEGARMLSRGLEKNSVLEVLDISYCNLSEDAVVRIVLALKSNSRLKELYLDHNQVMLGALHEIAETLSHNQSLTLLSLLGCSMGEHSMWLLLQGLNANNTLEVLRLDKTQDRSDQLYDLFLEILLKKNRRITELLKIKTIRV